MGGEKTRVYIVHCGVFSTETHWSAQTLPQGNSKAQPKANKYPTFHFSPSNCCLPVVLQLEKGDYPKYLHVVLCPNEQHSFLSFLTFHAFGSCFRMLAVILVSESFVTSIRHACFSSPLVVKGTAFIFCVLENLGIIITQGQYCN